MKQIILKHEGYFITGKAKLNLWGGGQGAVVMKPFHVNHLREIRDKINDNGFGCESIEEACCNIHRHFVSDNHYVDDYIKTIFI